MAREKKIKKGNTLNREEFGYGFDISTDDLQVIGKNNQAKKQNEHVEKPKKNRPPTN